MNQELNPCPFCNAKKDVVLVDLNKLLYWVKCNDCMASGPKCKKPENAVKLWNDAWEAQIPF
ncbi:MAG: Lar family restriction alleviation protein [Sphingobacteriaceae bacterium]|nr:Lar family restriction alleviation protein [Sphingobacteriaceae bacterium]